MFVAVAWPCLPTRIRFPAESRILIISWAGRVFFVYILSCVVSGGGHNILLTTDSARTALVYLSTVLIHDLAHPTGICPTDI